jgi:hypothetical protein
MITALAIAYLKWDKPLPADAVTHWRIFRGIELVAEVKNNRADVALPTDRISTLTVIAYNQQGASEPSDPFHVIPVTPQTSDNLTDWQPQQTFFVERKAKQFFRFSFPQ